MSCGMFCKVFAYVHDSFDLMSYYAYDYEQNFKGPIESIKDKSRTKVIA